MVERQAKDLEVRVQAPVQVQHFLLKFDNSYVIIFKQLASEMFLHFFFFSNGADLNCKGLGLATNVATSPHNAGCLVSSLRL